jgi:ectoine hydroxylase-related dioxygenase (phytanoyl-CoA dioxygenase family)
MDPSSLKYRLTDDERQQFEQSGFLILENAIPDDLVERLISIVDRLDSQHRAEEGLTPHERVNQVDFVGMDEAFLELLDWPATFPKIWGILGWNIQLYHSHMTVSPALPPNERPEEIELHWHQDSDRLNLELETDPQPRISLKVAYFLTDTRELGRANLYLAPGSHLWSTRAKAASDGAEPEGATAVRVAPGSAVIFDRRIWHSASPNVSNVARKVLFYGYSYRWLRPRDDMTGARFMDRCDPIRRQLLGASSGGKGYTSPSDEDVPLRQWIHEHAGEQAVAR